MVSDGVNIGISDGLTIVEDQLKRIVQRIAPATARVIAVFKTLRDFELFYCLESS